MANFIRDFMAGVHGDELDSSSYRCTDRITDVGQKVLAIGMSPDGRMYAYGGACHDLSRWLWRNDPVEMAGSIRPEVRTVGAVGAAGQLLEVPPFFNAVDGEVTHLKWIDNRSLAIGTALGYLHIWSMAEVSTSLYVHVLDLP